MQCKWGRCCCSLRSNNISNDRTMKRERRMWVALKTAALADDCCARQCLWASVNSCLRRRLHAWWRSWHIDRWTLPWYYQALKRSFLCLTDGVRVNQKTHCTKANFLWRWRWSWVKTKKNAFSYQTQIWVPRVMNPTPMWFRLFDLVVAVWVGFGEGCTNMQISTEILCTAQYNDDGWTQSLLRAKSNGEGPKSKPCEIHCRRFEVKAAANKSPDFGRVTVKARRVKVQTQTTTTKSLTGKLRVQPSSPLDGGVQDFSGSSLGAHSLRRTSQCF